LGKYFFICEPFINVTNNRNSVELLKCLEAEARVKVMEQIHGILSLDKKISSI